MFKFCKWIFFLAKKWWCRNNRLPWKYTQLHRVAHLQSPSGHISHLPWTRGCKAAQDTRWEAGKSRWWFSPPIWNMIYRQLGSLPPIFGWYFFQEKMLKTSGNVAQFISLHPFPSFKWPECCESYKVASLAIKEPRRWYPWFWLHTTIALCCSLTWNITTSNSNRAPIHILGGSSQLVST